MYTYTVVYYTLVGLILLGYVLLHKDTKFDRYTTHSIHSIGICYNHGAFIFVELCHPRKKQKINVQWKLMILQYIQKLILDR